MFQDEARFGRINDVRRCWAPRPMRPLCQAMLTHEYTYAYAAVDVTSGELDSLILPHVNTHCMQLFLDEVGQRKQCRVPCPVGPQARKRAFEVPILQPTCNLLLRDPRRSAYRCRLL